MVNFPTSLDDGTSIPNPTGVNTQNSPDHASLHTTTGDAVKALEAKLGIGASTPAANKLLFGTGTGTTVWQGLTSAQLLAILSDETGTGSAVFATTPTLVTPKVDTINENTPANGVTVGGVNLKSGVVTGSGAGITANTMPGTSNTNNSITAQQINWTGTGVNSGIWWEELGRTTLGVAGNTISLSSFTARKYLRLLVSVQGTGGTISVNLRFNNDSGANYADRVTGANNGADTTSTSQTSALVTGAATYAILNYTADIVNIASFEKAGAGIRFDGATAGAATAPGSNRYAFKWANTAAQITRVDVLNLAGGGTFAIGSEVVVLGHN